MNRFIRVKPELSSTGRIQDPLTISLLNSYASDDVVYVVDIPLTRRDDVISLMTSLSERGSTTTVYLRWVGDILRMSDLVGCIWCTFGKPEVMILASSHGCAEAWIVFTAYPVALLRGPEGIIITRTQHEWVAPVLPADLGGGVEYILNILEGPLHLLPDSMVDDSVLQSILLLESAVGDLSHRYSYKQWTAIIHSAVCHRVRIAEDPLSLIMEMVSYEHITVRICQHNVPVTMSVGLIRLLTRVLPRLL